MILISEVKYSNQAKTLFGKANKRQVMTTKMVTEAWSALQLQHLAE